MGDEKNPPVKPMGGGTATSCGIDGGEIENPERPGNNNPEPSEYPTDQPLDPIVQSGGEEANVERSDVEGSEAGDEGRDSDSDDLADFNDDSDSNDGWPFGDDKVDGEMNGEVTADPENVQSPASIIDRPPSPIPELGLPDEDIAIALDLQAEFDRKRLQELFANLVHRDRRTYQIESDSTETTLLRSSTVTSSNTQSQDSSLKAKGKEVEQDTQTPENQATEPSPKKVAPWLANDDSAHKPTQSKKKWNKKPQKQRRKERKKQLAEEEKSKSKSETSQPPAATEESKVAKDVRDAQGKSKAELNDQERVKQVCDEVQTSGGLSAPTTTSEALEQNSAGQASVDGLGPEQDVAELRHQQASGEES
ncbi:hypothetical protein BKA65DRAFT_551144 [Rhexocercosporidium sp. MPI-PUGE-AT-0058]|nr:hypothetical protein BKA65DRAFT_551144 [Rhexocercosporidium sp. MPI-PUGE-AT-0058]